jgi:hypothetical protein
MGVTIRSCHIINDRFDTDDYRRFLAFQVPL